jgi:co-chaperonin GroES (HSP10)
MATSSKGYEDRLQPGEVSRIMAAQSLAKSQEAENVVENTSGLHPLGVAVLVEPYEPERKKGLIELPPSVGERTTMVENRAIVIEVGPLAGKNDLEKDTPRAAVGDLVFITRYAGFMAIGPKDDKVYRLVNDRDIFCRIEKGV